MKKKLEIKESIKINIRDISRILKSSSELILETKFKSAASMILLTIIENELFVVLEKRAKNIRQGGELSLPGGFIDSKKDKEPINTALRETEEELGINSKHIQVLGKNSIFISPNGLIIHTYVGAIDYKYLLACKYNKKEVEKLLFVPLNYFITKKPKKYYAISKIHSVVVDKNGNEKVIFPAKKLGLPERYWDSWGEGKYEILFYNYDNETIWGITAKILKNFVEKIKSHKIIK